MKISTYIQNNQKSIFRTVIITLSLIFIALSIFVLFTKPEYLDIHISEEIQEEQTPILNKIMVVLSSLGRLPISLTMVLGTALLFLISGYKKEAILMLSTLLSGALGIAIKTIINRPRPSRDFVIIMEDTKFQSFPSGHVLFYTVFFGSLILIILHLKKIQTKAKIILISLCLAIIFFGAVSRVYLGAHWFTDVFGGFILGIICVMIMGHYYLKNDKISEIIN
jgi:undecaprenyl-diphosphatase